MILIILLLLNSVILLGNMSIHICVEIIALRKKKKKSQTNVISVPAIY